MSNPIDRALQASLRIRKAFAEGGDAETSGYDPMGNYVGPVDRPVEQPVMDPDLMGKAWQGAVSAYRTRKEGEPTARAADLSWRDKVGAAIAGDNRSDAAARLAKTIVGSSGLPDSGMGFGVIDAIPGVGAGTMGTDAVDAAARGHYGEAALTGALGAAPIIGRPVARGVRTAYDAVKEYIPKAAAALGVGATLAPEEAQASFAGPFAKTADRLALDAAKRVRIHELPSIGSVSANWRRHGWEQDPAGNWVYEIGDQNARLRPSAVKALDRGEDMRVGDALDHPELFAAYPSTFDTVLTPNPGYFRDTSEGFRRGYFNPTMNHVGVNPKLNDDEMLNTLLHELQHKHAQFEGGQPGGSPAQFKSDEPAYLKERLAGLNDAQTWLGLRMRNPGLKISEIHDLFDQQMAAEGRRAAPGFMGNIDTVRMAKGELSPQEMMRAVNGQIPELRAKLDEIAADPRTPHEKYLALTGEQMARLPGERRLMSDDARRMNYPLEMPGAINQPNTGRIENIDSPRWDAFAAALRHARGGYASGGKIASKVLDEVIHAVGNIGKPAQVKIPGLGFVPADPIPGLSGAADSYMRSIGRPGEHHIQQFPPFNPAWAEKVAGAYDAMRHDPANPEVKRAYEALIDETMAQYQAVKDAGLDVRFLKDGQADPYARSPSMGYQDIKDNGRLFVFPTDAGFGSNSLFDVASNPLLKGVGRVGDKNDAVVNDAFRVVHDVYGHFAPGNPFFRAPGEERAYQLHSQMYSPEARPAMASETRGQNSWVNYGPHGEANRSASGADTVYADQKTGVMPRWAQETPPEGADLDAFIKSLGEEGKAGGGLVTRAMRKLTDLGFYSHGSEVAQALKQLKGDPEQMKAMLLKQGVKPAELNHAGYDDAMKGVRSVTRDDISDLLQSKLPTLTESVRGQDTHLTPRYGEYTLPGHEDYTERLLRLGDPAKTTSYRVFGAFPQDFDTAEEANAYIERIMNGVRGNPEMQRALGPQLDRYPLSMVPQTEYTRDPAAYASSHWDDPNVLLHMRHSYRPGTRGENQMHLEELQSDWAQDGRKRGFKGTPEEIAAAERENGDNYIAFRDALRADGQHSAEELDRLQAARAASLKRLEGLENGVPRAPFVTNTSDWTDLAIKRALRLAAQNGSDALTWSTGAQNAGHYGLEKRFSRLDYSPQSGRLVGYDPYGVESLSHWTPPEELHEAVGRDLAQRMLDSNPEVSKGYQLFDVRTGRPAREDVHTSEDTLWERYPNLAQNGNYEARPIDRQVHSIQGDDLKFGGEGMRAYYDSIVPKRVSEVLRKVDPDAPKPQIGGFKASTDGDYADVNGVDLPATTRGKILSGGFPQFAEGGEVEEQPQGPDIDAVLDYAHQLGSSDPSLMDRAMSIVQQFNPVSSAEAAPLENVARAGLNLARKFGKPTVEGVAKDAARFPGIYGNPREIADEAASRIAPRSSSLPEVFGVTRDDLYDMGAGIKGNMEPQLNAPKKPRGSNSAAMIENKRNENRLIDVLGEASRHPELTTGMDAWYEMQPVYQAFERLFGPEEAKRRYNIFNHSLGMMSPASEVTTEINRGTAAYALGQQGRIKDFQKYGGIPEIGRGRDFPEDMRHVIAHPYHSTAHTGPLMKFLDKGYIDSKKPKVPLYVQASGVPETGFQTSLPVPDAHFTRALGMADARLNTATPDKSMSMSELMHAGPWFRDKVAKKVGLEAVPAQARLWGVMSGQTGVTSPIAAPKIELLADHIMDMARRHGMSPQDARDALLRGEKFQRGGSVSALAIARRLAS